MRQPFGHDPSRQFAPVPVRWGTPLLPLGGGGLFVAVGTVSSWEPSAEYGEAAVVAHSYIGPPDASLPAEVYIDAGNPASGIHVYDPSGVDELILNGGDDITGRLVGAIWMAPVGFPALGRWVAWFLTCAPPE